MSRYIDADILREEWLQDAEYNANDFLDSIDSQPTADVEVVRHAYPCVSFNDAFSERLVIMCSKCGGKIQKKDKFCKHCGAKMDGETYVMTVDKEIKMELDEEDMKWVEIS